MVQGCAAWNSGDGWLLLFDGADKLRQFIGEHTVWLGAGLRQCAWQRVPYREALAPAPRDTICRACVHLICWLELVHSSPAPIARLSAAHALQTPSCMRATSLGPNEPAHEPAAQHAGIGVRMRRLERARAAYHVMLATY